ncbi:MAG: hypothetical protein K6B43_03135 [Treponema sp.]|nr:hypothetical protein [Treponema sp.]
MCKRKSTLPDFQSILEICAILGRDIKFFTSGQQDNSENQDSDTSEISLIFPANSSNIMGTVIRDDFKDYVENAATGLTLQISFFLSGAEKSRKFYNRMLFEVILEKLISAKSSDSIGAINISLYLPKFFSVEDVLSLEDVNFDTEINDALNELFDEIKNDFSQFRLKLFHKFNTDLLSRVNFSLHTVNFSKDDIEKAECAVIVNDYAIFTSGSKYAITHEAGMSQTVRKIREQYTQKEVHDTIEDMSIPASKKKELKTLASKFLDSDSIDSENTEKFLQYFDDAEHKKLVRNFLGNFVLTGLPGTGKSTITAEIKRLCGIEETESSDLYINYRIFDDNGEDSRSAFKKISKANFKPYLEIREQTVLSTICKAVGKRAILDIGGKEIFYDSIYMKLLDNDFTIVNLVYSDDEKIDDEEKMFDTYLQYLIKHPEIVDRQKRSNLYNAACREDGAKDVTSKKFKTFIQNLFQKRFSQYVKRSHFSVIRKENDTAEYDALKVIASILARRI